MNRTLTVVGAAIVAVVGAVAASQAQGRPGIGQGIGPGADRFECGPARPGEGQGQGVRPGRAGQPNPQGAMRGRGPGGGRQGGLGRPGGPGRMGGRGNPLCDLDLTEEQKTQIEAIHQKTRDEVEAVLTPEQKEKLRARRGGRVAGR